MKYSSLRALISQRGPGRLMLCALQVFALALTASLALAFVAIPAEAVPAISAPAGGGPDYAAPDPQHPIVAPPGSGAEVPRSPSVQWQKVFRIDNRDCSINSVIQCPDGGYLAAGSIKASVQDSMGFLRPNETMLIVKTDAEGNKLWEKILGESGPDYESCAKSVLPTPDGHYIVAGYRTVVSTNLEDHRTTQSYSSLPNQLYVKHAYWLVLDSSGNVLQEESCSVDPAATLIYRDVDYEYYTKLDTITESLQPSGDGGYIIAGTVVYSESNDEESFCGPFLLKLNSQRHFQWVKDLRYDVGEQNYFTCAVRQTPDGGYIIGGFSVFVYQSTFYGFDLNSSYYDQFQGIHLVKTDGAGNKTWDKSFGRDSLTTCRDIAVTPNGGYIIAGEKGRLFYLLNTDQQGNKLWDKTFGSLAGQASAVINAGDGDYIVAGGIYNQNDREDVYLTKVDPQGNIRWDMRTGARTGDSGPDNYSNTSDNGLSLAQTSDGGCIIGGISRENSRDRSLLIRTDGPVYSASGKIATGNGEPLTNITVTFTRTAGSGPVPEPATTGPDGKWNQSGFQTGSSYRATPGGQGYAFIPAAKDFIGTTRNLDFTALATYSVSGRVTDGGGRPLAGVTMTFTGTLENSEPPRPVTTDADGRWSQSGFVPGMTYRVTPYKANQAFSPAFASFTGASSNLDFKAQQGFYVSGRINPQGNLSRYGVAINFSRLSGSGSVPQSVTTDINGYWSQSGFASGTTYRATPEKPQYAFAAPYQDFSSQSTSLNFTALAGFSAGGQVTLRGASRMTTPVSGVKITFSAVAGTGAVPGPAVTDSNGHWQQTGFSAGTSYRAAPSYQNVGLNQVSAAAQLNTGAAAVTFSPAALDFDTQNLSLDFTLIPGYTASGRVLTGSGQPLPGVNINFAASDGGEAPSPVTTGNNGSWSQAGFIAGKVYRTTPFKPGHTFTPSGLEVSSAGSNYNFTGLSDTTPPVVAAMPAGGSYASAQTVTLESSEPSTIYYTTDGSTPGTDSRIYQGALTVSANTVIKFIAVDGSGNSSQIGTAAYTIGGAPSVSWTGTWSTNWGTVTLEQKGSRVTGSYPGWNGRISGSVVGGKLSGTWTEDDYSGDFEAEMSASGNLISGRWLSGGKADNWTILHGSRVR